MLLMWSYQGGMVLIHSAELIYTLPLPRFKREMTLLILLATATPTGGIAAEFAGPRGHGRTWA